MLARRLLVLFSIGLLVFAGLSFSPPISASAQPTSVVGSGTPASCTDAAWAAAVTAGGTVTFDCGPNPHSILVTTKVIDQPLVVDGGGKITLDGQGTLQIFYVMAGGNLTLQNITLANGVFGNGGALFNSGSVTLANVTITNNQADGGNGGGIYNQGTLTVTGSDISNNTATNRGGAIFNESGALTVADSNFSNNRALQGGAFAITGGTMNLRSSLLVGNGYASADLGGGIYNTAAITITNVTFAGNYAASGGGLYNTQQASILNSTFYINHADLGGAIFNYFGNTLVRNTILASSLSLDGTYNSLNCDGPAITSQGNNIASDNSCALALASDHPSTDPLLDSLMDNGGPTLTHLPKAGSPAIDQGDSTACPTSDQRGVSRPQGPACDIGAVEVLVPITSYPLYLPLIQR